MFQNHFSGKYTKALVLGTGGGNDIISSLIIALDLQKQGIQTDIAGILSPGAVHYFDRKKEQIINPIVGDVSRYINGKNLHEISFVDAVLPDIASHQGIHIPNYYDFSTRFGTQKLSDEIQRLIATNKYDLFVAVDVGGDILARGKEDANILSPMMDFTALHLLKTLNIDKYLIEFGLLTDGELRPQGAKEILEALSETGCLIDQGNISLEDENVQSFIKVFDEIKKIRAGHTGVMTLETLKNTGSYQDLHTEYRFRSQIGKEKRHTSFHVHLPYEYFGKAYLIDAEKFVQQRETTAFSYENTLEQYIRLKSISTNWKTEMDLFALRSGDNRTTARQKGECLQCLVPSLMIDSQDRNDIITAGIKQLYFGAFDMALLLNEDVHLMRNSTIQIEEAGNFSLLYRDKIQSFISDTKALLQKYQL